MKGYIDRFIERVDVLTNNFSLYIVLQRVKCHKIIIDILHFFSYVLRYSIITWQLLFLIIVLSKIKNKVKYFS